VAWLKLRSKAKTKTTKLQIEHVRLTPDWLGLIGFPKKETGKSYLELQARKISNKD